MGWSSASEGWRQAHEAPGRPFAVPAVEDVNGAPGTTITTADSWAPIIKKRITNSSGVGVTLTSTPTIPDGKFDGQLLILEIDNGAVSNIIIQDEATLAGSNLRLSAATLTANARDTYGFVWDADDGSWVELWKQANL